MSNSATNSNEIAASDVEGVVMLCCPFCGVIPVASDYRAYSSDHDSKYDVDTYGRVECDCGARGPDVHIGSFSSREWQAEAVRQWNHRA